MQNSVYTEINILLISEIVDFLKKYDAYYSQ